MKLSALVLILLNLLLSEGFINGNSRKFLISTSQTRGYSNLAMTKPGQSQIDTSNTRAISINSLVGISTMAIMLGHGDVAHASEISAIVVARPLFDIFVNTMSLLFLVRTVLSWYPKTDLNKFPYNIAAWPTEPLLVPVRSLVPPAFGVDVSAIVWVMLLSFLREILTGQQGILTLLEKQ